MLLLRLWLNAEVVMVASVKSEREIADNFAVQARREMGKRRKNKN